MNFSVLNAEARRDVLIAALEQCLDFAKLEDAADVTYLLDTLRPALEDLNGDDFFGTEGLFHLAGID